jgi:hypothetical protein
LADILVDTSSHMHLFKATTLTATLTAFVLLSFISTSSAVNVTLDSRYSTGLMTIISNCNFEVWYQMCDENCVLLNDEGSAPNLAPARFKWLCLLIFGLATHQRH